MSATTPCRDSAREQEGCEGMSEQKASRAWKPAAVTVGQEVLYGERANDNLLWLLQEFVRFGKPAAAAMVLPDDEAAIGEGIRWLVAQRFRPVFVSGGIGGTHDDRTRQGISMGLGLPLVCHEECFARLSRRYGDRFTPQRQRMAWLPQGARLIDNPIGAPGFFIDPVYAFPGFPEMLRPMAKETLRRLLGSRRETETRVMERTLKVSEGDIAEEVERFVAEHPGVEIGLYPKITPRGPEVTVRCRAVGADEATWRKTEELLGKLEASHIPASPFPRPGIR